MPQQNALGARPKRVTIADVSAAVGLTKGTVSRALNDYPDISPSTRARVRSVAQRMGYVPLGQAQGMSTGRTRSIGLVVQMSEHDGHRPFLADFLAGISFAASRENWTLTVATADDALTTRTTMERLITERKADGFILPRTRINDPRVALLQSADVPFVMFGRTKGADDAAWFDILQEEAMKEAVIHLHGLGHRRIGFINGAMSYTYSHIRLDGYRSGLAAVGLLPDPALEVSGVRVPEEGDRAARDLLARPSPPTAIVCALDAAALGAYRAARAHGLRIGRDLSLISYDGAPEGAFVDPPLSTYRVDIRAAGERLAHMLIELIRGARPEMLREYARATFLNRGSAGAPSHSSEDLQARIGAGDQIQREELQS